MLLITQKGDKIVQKIDEIEGKFDSWSSNLRGKISDFFDDIVADTEEFSPLISHIFDQLGIDVTYVFDTVKADIDIFLQRCRNTIDLLHKLFNGDFAGAFEIFKGMISDDFREIGNDCVRFVNSIISKFESMANFLIRGINGLLSKFNEISFDIPDWVPGIGGNSVDFNIKTLNEVVFGRIPMFASGGFPSMGQMFIAREAGPELVGRIGNKNAVVNNNQIIQGIATAVYNAMMAAHEDGNSGGGGTSKIVVQIGDRAVGEASVRYINGQIVQTGMSPIYT